MKKKKVIATNKVIAIASRKGGVGKSTTMIHLRDWLIGQDFTTCLIDGDPQEGSSAPWAIAMDGPPDSSLVFRIPDGKTILRKVSALKGKVDFVLIDAPGVMGPETLAAINAADIVLVPGQPSQLDIASSTETLEEVASIQLNRNGPPKAFTFVSAAHPSSSAASDCIEMFKEEIEKIAEGYKEDGLPKPDIHVCSNPVNRRQIITDVASYPSTVFREAEGKGKTNPATIAMKEYQALFKEVFSG